MFQVVSHVILCLYILMSPVLQKKHGGTSSCPPHLVTKGVLSQGIVTSHLPSHTGKSALDSESTIIRSISRAYKQKGLISTLCLSTQTSRDQKEGTGKL